MEKNNFKLKHLELYDYPDQNYWQDKYFKLKIKYDKLLKEIDNLENKLEKYEGNNDDNEITEN